MDIYWNHAATSLLINMVEKEEMIWDMEHPDYRNKYVRVDRMKKIAVQLQKPEEAVKKKWTNLRSYYQRELGKVAKTSDLGPLQCYISKWEHFNSMTFLNKCINSTKDQDFVSIVKEENLSSEDESSNKDANYLINQPGQRSFENVEVNPEPINRFRENIPLPFENGSSINEPISSLSDKPHRQFDNVETTTAEILPPNRENLKRSFENAPPNEFIPPVREKMPKIFEKPNISNEIPASSSAKDDEFTAFGNMVATELRKVPPRLINDKKMRIAAILFEPL